VASHPQPIKTHIIRGCSNRSPRMLTIESTIKNLRTALIQSNTNISVPLLKPTRVAKRAYSNAAWLFLKVAMPLIEKRGRLLSKHASGAH
jgi:hypothetical protein